MKNRAFKIQYSYIVNGEEYARSIVLGGKDKDDAIQQLKDMVHKADPNAELIITESSPV